MILKQNISVYGHSLVIVQETHSVQDNLGAIWNAEEREPIHRSAGDKIGTMVLNGFVTGASQSQFLLVSLLEAEPRKVDVPRRSLGTSSRGANEQESEWTFPYNLD